MNGGVHVPPGLHPAPPRRHVPDALYRAVYAVLGPVYPVLRALAPGAVTTTVQVGRAMIAVARDGYPKADLEARDINAAADRAPRTA